MSPALACGGECSQVVVRNELVSTPSAEEHALCHGRAGEGREGADQVGEGSTSYRGTTSAGFSR